MLIFVSIIHVLACVILILVILLQTGKGSDLGAMLGGGGSNTLFGSTGASTFLSKLTTGVAVLFMITCLALAYLSAHEQTVTVDGSAPTALPVDQAVTPEQTQDSMEAAPDQPAAEGDAAEAAPEAAQPAAEAEAPEPAAEPPAAEASAAEPPAAQPAAAPAEVDAQPASEPTQP